MLLSCNALCEYKDAVDCTLSVAVVAAVVSAMVTLEAAVVAAVVVFVAAVVAASVSLLAASVALLFMEENILCGTGYRWRVFV